MYSKWSFYIQYDATIELSGYHLSTHDANKSKKGALQVNTRKLFMKHKQNLKSFLQKWSFYIQFDATIEEQF